MRKLFYLLSVLVTISSCSPIYYQPQTYYQNCKVSSDLQKTDTGAYMYDSENDCTFAYDFRGDGGKVWFVISNNTDSMIYVDLQKSFLIKNGMAYDYFLNREREKPIVTIPPYAFKCFYEYSIATDRFKFPKMNDMPLGNENDTCSFDLSNTPLKFTNFICYRVGDDGGEKIVKNSFFIREISNHKEYVYCSPGDFNISYIDAEEIETPSNTIEDNIVANEDSPSIESMRDSNYIRLLEIKKSIINGTEKDRNKTIEEYNEIKLWYKNILDIYPEIQNLLKEVKRLL